MTITESISAWLRQYPSLSGRLDIDGPDDEAATYSLDVIPCREELKRYLDGSSLRQYQFAVSSRRFHDRNISQNLDNLEFFEDLAAWIQSPESALPELDGGRSARRVTVSGPGNAASVSADGTARYQMQLCLEYYQQ